MLIDLPQLKLRKVSEEDSRLLWTWANNPEVRNNSFSTDPIAWEKHQQWFNQKLTDPNCYIFIALAHNEQPIGQVRFDIWDNEEAEISLSIDKKKRGLGHGYLLIELSVQEIFATTRVSTIHAWIKSDNQSSTKSFEKAGFKCIETKIIQENLALHYLINRSSK